MTALISDRIGRKATCLISCVPALLGWVCLGVSHIVVLMLGRFLLGLGMGIEGSLHSIFLNELLSPGLREPCIASGIVTITGGILLIFLLGTWIQWQVQRVFLVQLNQFLLAFVDFVKDMRLDMRECSLGSFYLDGVHCP